jgi:hypothetical protein
MRSARRRQGEKQPEEKCLPPWAGEVVHLADQRNSSEEERGKDDEDHLAPDAEFTFGSHKKHPDKNLQGEISCQLDVVRQEIPISRNDADDAGQERNNPHRSDSEPNPSMPFTAGLVSADPLKGSSIYDCRVVPLSNAPVEI